MPKLPARWQMGMIFENLVLISNISTALSRRPEGRRGNRVWLVGSF